MSQLRRTMRLPVSRANRGIGVWGGLALLIVTGILALLAYSRLGTAMPEALTATAVFTVAWAVLFAVIPFVVGLLIFALFALLILGGLYAMSQAQGNVGQTLLFVFVGLLLLILFFVLLPLVPGAVLGKAVYDSLGGGTTGVFAGVATFVVVTLVVLVVWYILRDLVFPFVTGYLWAFISGTLAHQIAVAVITGEAAAAWQPFAGLAKAPNVVQAAERLPTLLQRLLMLEFIPAPLGLWLVAVSVGVGVLTVIRHMQDKRGQPQPVGYPAQPR